ncbi:MAG: hypothetical protein ACXADL_06800 [Candidatus Thorarchaeota archaeon]|jgi:hypothetical protein
MSLDVSKVRYVSLIRLEGGESILNIPFAEMTVDPDLIAGFVTAVIIFAKTPIRTIRKAAYDILIEVGETVLVLLVCDPVPDEAPYRVRMTRILKQVEEEHGEKLTHFEGDIRRFREFSLEVLKEFPFKMYDFALVPTRNSKGVNIPFRVGKTDRKLEQVENFINGKRTLAEILDLIGLPEEEVLAAISILAKYKWISFKKRTSDNDILITKDCPKPALDRLGGQYGEPMQDLLNSFDGTKKVSEVIDSLPYDRNALWFLINKLSEMGCLGPVGT